ncbi:MAG: HAD-IC family P-type ATPase [Bacteroidetes bacterium]|jgi:Ca2+-transporting ATPase|nr:HAD-IC family P-type ATPase [Bacteroidota bacterium]
MTDQSGVAEREAPPEEYPAEAPWSQPGDAVLDALVTTPDGLAGEEVERRQTAYGPNRLRKVERRSLWEILRNQVSLILVLLFVAGAVALLSGQQIEALAIGVVIVINTAIGFFTEWRAVRSMEALQEMGETMATVRRGGQTHRVPAEALVPGDIVELDEGDLVPADLRLLRIERLRVDESALTGESVPVSKHMEPVDADTGLADRVSMAYKGTAVARGTGVGVVVATGMNTELGEISAMVETASGADTPLEQKLDRLGRRLLWLTLGVAVVVTGVGVLAGRDVYLMIETGIALAVAAIPEGLPIVATLALAYGMWRMARRNALVRRLSSVETLGATTLICTDKTGTLTENQMTVRTLRLPGAPVDVEEDGEAVRFVQDGAPADPDDDVQLRQALQVAVLCNSATLETEGDGAPTGDPMELALLEMGRRANRARESLIEQKPQRRTVPFDRETKMMATYHEQGNGELLVAVKGAPEAVLDASTHSGAGDGGDQPLDDDARGAWVERSEALAADGLRVLALASKTVPNADAPPYDKLHFLGLIGLFDPPRSDVKPVIDRCQQAGIRVVMVTGDHPATAQTVAEEVGIVDAGEATIIKGSDIAEIVETSADHRARLRKAAIFARVDPAQKLRLVDLHQAEGEIVAMTGDGVNDAPALRSADIGVAMGRRGTDVAREAANMILQDDALSSIVTAVRQGRIIFSNIRKFVVYLLSGNVGEILAVGAAAVANAPLPLLPLQILYLNLLNDVFPALALGVGPGTKRVMARPPRDPEEEVITDYHWGLIGGYGVLIGAVVLGVFTAALWGLRMPPEQAVTVSFLTLSISRLVHVFNVRSSDSGVFDNEISRNPYLWAAFGICGGLLALAVYWPLMADVLSVQPPGAAGWGLVASGAIATLLIGQGYVALRGRKAPN